MSEVLKMSKKAFTVGVVATTIAWSIGLSALLAPMTAGAATSGQLVKASLPAVYYVGGDGKRYVFPNEKTYKTWYADFSGVVTITDSELAAMMIGGNVTYKPGVRMVKITSDNKVYVVDAHGTLRPIASEQVAKDLYGTDWNKKIDDVPDAFFTNYSLGSEVTAATQYAPATVVAAATSINADKNLGGTGSVSGDLTVALSSSGPVGGTLPGGATNVNVLKVDVKNGSSSAMSVDGLTVRRIGSGQTGDFANLYVYEGNNRLTTGRTLNTSTHEATFSGLGVSLAAGETKSLWIAVDVAAAPGAGNVDQFQLVNLSSGTVAASGLPVSGPSFSMSAAAAGNVTITRSGANPLANVKLGGLGQKVAEFQVAAGAGEDVRLSKIALMQGGAVSRSNITNLVLKQAGLTLATATGFDSKDRVTFVLANPMTLEKGATRTFEVYADIAGNARAGATETVLMYVDQPSDVLAVGATYGYGVTVRTAAPGTYDGTGCVLGAGNCSSTRIEGGQVTITYNGPAMKDVAVNGKDVEVYNFTIASAANLEIRNLRMQITAANIAGANDGLIDTSVAPAVANYSDIKVVDTASGATIAGPLSLNTAGLDTVQALTYTEVINLVPGQARTFKVTADVANNQNATFANDTVRVDLLAFAANDIRNLDNSTYVALTDIVPNTGINGNAHNIKLPTLTVGMSSTPVAQTYIQGSQGIKLAGVTLKAGDASDMRVNTLVLDGEIDDVPASGFAIGQETLAGNTIAGIVQTVKLMNGSAQLGETRSPTASTAVGNGGVVTFSNLNLTVAKGQTITLDLVANLANGLAGLNDNIRFVVRNAASVSVTDPDGNGVTALGVFPTNGPAMTVANAGTLTLAVAPDDTESEAGLVVGGSSNVVLAKYKLTAQNEELKLSKAQISVSTPANATGVSSVSLYDGATLVGGPASVDGAGIASFTGMNFVVAKDASKVLTVKANLNSVGATGATSGLDLKVQIDAANFEARGTSAGSSTVLVAPTTGALPMLANSKITHKTKPTVSLVSLPSTVLAAGDQTVSRFTVAADAAGDVAIKALTFTINKTTAMTPAVLAQSSIRRDGTVINGSTAWVSLDTDGAGADTAVNCGNTDDTCTLYTDFATEEVVAAGTSRTYELRLNLTNVPAGSGSIGVVVASDVVGNNATGALTNVGAVGKALVAAINPALFVWSDLVNPSHSAVYGNANASDWITGSYVKTLPSDSQTMSK